MNHRFSRSSHFFYFLSQTNKHQNFAVSRRVVIVRKYGLRTYQSLNRYCIRLNFHRVQTFARKQGSNFREELSFAFWGSAIQKVMFLTFAGFFVSRFRVQEKNRETKNPRECLDVYYIGMYCTYIHI